MSILNLRTHPLQPTVGFPVLLTCSVDVSMLA